MTIRSVRSSSISAWVNKSRLTNSETSSRATLSRSPEETTSKVSPWDKVSSLKVNHQSKILGRTRILMKKGHKGYRPRRTGERKRKSIRGCIVGQDIRVLALAIVKKGDAELAGVTDVQVPRRLGPKRLTKLRRLFGFKKDDGVALVKKNIIRRTFTTKDGKKR